MVNWLGLNPSSCNLRALSIVEGTFTRFLKENAIVPEDGSRNWITADIAIKPKDAGYKRSLSAAQISVESSHAVKFHHVILNLDPTLLKTTDPSEASGLPLEGMEAAFQSILAMYQWVEEQVQALRAGCFALRGFASVLQRYPGTGKSLVLAAKILFFIKIDVPCLIAAATHIATDDVLRKFVGLLRKCKDEKLRDYKPIRVYRQVHKEKAFIRGGLNTPVHDDSDADVTDTDVPSRSPDKDTFQELRPHTILFTSSCAWNSPGMRGSSSYSYEAA